MSISHFDGGASAAEEPAGRNGKAHPPEQGQKMGDAKGLKAAPQETPFWENAVGVAGLLIVLAVVGFLVYEALQPQTAASVTIEGALYDPAQGDEPVETAEVTFDYIPDQSDRSGSFVFEHDPREYEVRLQVKGFMDP
jgi:hypothetical protein